jgi:hypothetical protein
VDRCWASALGDCEGPLSDEHIVTAGLFDSSMLGVSGFDWCKGEVREIPRDRLVRRILCKGHNGRLEPYDKAAIRSARTFDEWQRLEQARAVIKPRRWTVSSFAVSGSDLERAKSESAVPRTKVCGASKSSNHGCRQGEYPCPSWESS